MPFRRSPDAEVPQLPDRGRFNIEMKFENVWSCSRVRGLRLERHRDTTLQHFPVSPIDPVGQAIQYSRSGATGSREPRDDRALNQRTSRTEH
jgi:hypothetical protein